MLDFFLEDTLCFPELGFLLSVLPLLEEPVRVLLEIELSLALYLTKVFF
jgi:hypothetical protein